MIGIITAMSSEAEAIKSLMEITEESEEAGCVFSAGNIEGEPLVVCLGGVGKALAAMATTLLIQKYDPDLVMNVGVAGGMKESQKVCDLVVSSEIIQGDYDTTPVDGPAGLGKYFETPIKLQNHAQRVMSELPIRSELGAICSQDKFVTKGPDVKRIQVLFPQSACAEMEAGAIAQVCAAFGVDLVAIKSLSDVAVHDSNPMEYSEFEKKAARTAGEFVQAWCRSLD